MRAVRGSAGPLRRSHLRHSRARRLRLMAGAMLLLATGACRVVTLEPEPPRPVPRPAPVDPGTPPRPAPDRPLDFSPARTFDEVRAVWVVRFTMTSEESIREMIDNAEAAGINTLIVQVRGRADAFYASSIEPPGESMRSPGTFDPLDFTIREAHARGMAVHAWVNTHLVWGPTDRPESPTHIINAHPDWLAVPRELGRELLPVDPFDPEWVDRLVRYARENDDRVEGVYTSPSHPEVQDRVHAVWMDLAARYDLDGLHFDYIRFPNGAYDYSIGALERFRLWARGVLPAARWEQLDAAYEADLFAFVDGEAELWAAFRREQVTRLVERIYRDVKRIRPDLTISAAVIADRSLAIEDRFQDWPGWLERGILDIAVPMAYTPDAGRFQALVEDARSAAGHPDRVWAGIGAYMNTAEGTLEMIDIARRQDAGGIVIFSYDWAVGEGLGDPARPLLQRIGEERFGR